MLIPRKYRVSVLESKDICKKESIITSVLLHQQTPTSRTVNEENELFYTFELHKKETDFYCMDDPHLC